MNLQDAQIIADEVFQKLYPFCESGKCLITGSIRREKPEVKDIEICCIPSMEEFYDEKSESLFNFPYTARSSEFIRTVKSLGSIEKGSPEIGKYLAIMLPEGIKLDLFIPDPPDFFRQFAIRTGSADYSWKVLAAGWKRLGWCGSDIGLRKMADCIEKKDGQGKSLWKCVKTNAEKPPVWNSENEFFQWLGIKWIEPKDRFI